MSTQLTTSGLTLRPDLPVCQSDLPLDWYSDAFKPYAEEYLALPDRTPETVLPWLDHYVLPAVDHFGAERVMVPVTARHHIHGVHVGVKQQRWAIRRSGEHPHRIADFVQIDLVEPEQPHLGKNTLRHAVLVAEHAGEPHQVAGEADQGIVVHDSQRSGKDVRWVRSR